MVDTLNPVPRRDPTPVGIGHRIHHTSHDSAGHTSRTTSRLQATPSRVSRTSTGGATTSADAAQERRKVATFLYLRAAASWSSPGHRMPSSARAHARPSAFIFACIAASFAALRSASALRFLPRQRRDTVSAVSRFTPRTRARVRGDSGPFGGACAARSSSASRCLARKLPPPWLRRRALKTTNCL